MKKKIGVVTGTRAEYGLLKPLLDLISNDDDCELILFVTGAHLSPEFGLTATAIEKDGIPISERIEILLSSDTPAGITKSMGLALIGFADAFVRKRPDILVLLGDRFEVFAAASAAMVTRVPIAHIHGGELTEGLIDDAMRHSVTKMSLLHFVSTETYRRRVIQLGELPESVFVVGALGIDLIQHARYATRSEVLTKFPLVGKYEKSLLVTLHPETLAAGTSADNARLLLDALESFKDCAIVFTGSNSDTEGRTISSQFVEYCSQRDNCMFSQNLGSYYYLGLMSIVSAVVGNSSSGILEAPALGTPSVDIGSRQKGRVMPESVAHCENTVDEIAKAIHLVLARPRGASLDLSRNPYWSGGAAEKIYDRVKNIDCTTVIKTFHDIPVPG